MAGFIEYETYDATGLAALIAGCQVSAAEVLEEAIGRAERWQPSINAITIPLYEHARAAARRGLPAGPLSGGAVSAQGSRGAADWHSDLGLRQALGGFRRRS